jgi:hypothetical protein
MPNQHVRKCRTKWKTGDKINHTLCVPRDCIKEIFGHLTSEDVLACVIVCKRWNACAVEELQSRSYCNRYPHWGTGHNIQLTKDVEKQWHMSLCQHTSFVQRSKRQVKRYQCHVVRWIRRPQFRCSCFSDITHLVLPVHQDVPLILASLKNSAEGRIFCGIRTTSGWFRDVRYIMKDTTTNSLSVYHHHHGNWKWHGRQRLSEAEACVQLLAWMDKDYFFIAEEQEGFLGTIVRRWSCSYLTLVDQTIRIPPEASEEDDLDKSCQDTAIRTSSMRHGHGLTSVSPETLPADV